MFILLLVFCWSVIGLSEAAILSEDFLESLQSVRADGIGNAFVSQGDDALGFHANSAGIAQIQHLQMALKVQRQERAIGIAVPVSPSASLSGSFWVQHRRRTLSVGLGWRIQNNGKNFLSLGMDLRGFTEPETVEGIALDVGILARPERGRVAFGAAIQNMGPHVRRMQYSEPLPLSWRIGTSYILSLKHAATVHAELSRVGEDDPRLKAGMEMRILQPLFVRIGYRRATQGDGQMAAGMGLVWNGLGLDYAWEQKLSRDAIHSFQIHYTFGGSNLPPSLALVQRPSPRANSVTSSPVQTPQHSALRTQDTSAFDGTSAGQNSDIRVKENPIPAGQQDESVDVPLPRIRIACVPMIFTPDQDGVDDTTEFSVTSESLETLKDWDFFLSIHGPTGKTVYRSPVAPLPARIVWDGNDDEGEPLPMGNYTFWLEGRHRSGQRYVSSPQIVTISEREHIIERIVIAADVLFELDAVDIRESAYKSLKVAAQAIRTHPNAEINIEGHADDSGDDTANMRLSAERAAKVFTYLVERESIPAYRLSMIGYGRLRPIDERDPQQNRRVEIIITTNEQQVER